MVNQSGNVKANRAETAEHVHMTINPRKQEKMKRICWQDLKRLA